MITTSCTCNYSLRRRRALLRQALVGEDFLSVHWYERHVAALDSLLFLSALASSLQMMTVACELALWFCLLMSPACLGGRSTRGSLFIVLQIVTSSQCCSIKSCFCL